MNHYTTTAAKTDTVTSLRRNGLMIACFLDRVPGYDGPTAAAVADYLNGTGTVTEQAAVIRALRQQIAEMRDKERAELAAMDRWLDSEAGQEFRSAAEAEADRQGLAD